MARVVFSGIITDITGSIGGITFQKNRSGNIVRLRPGTYKKKTTKQSESQARHAKFLQLWQGLTLADRNQWDSFALANTKSNQFGEVKTLTGLNWFESINVNRDILSLAAFATPPTHTLPIPPTSFTFTVSSSELKIDFTAPFSPADNALFFKMTSPISRVSTSVNKFLRLVKIETSQPFTTIDLKPAWESYFGIAYPPAPSGNCFNISLMLQTVNVDSGIQSTGVITTSKLNEPTSGIGFMDIGGSFIVS